jgi:hypothetical protein
MRRAMLIGLASVAMTVAACGSGSIGESEGAANEPAVDDTVSLLIDENTETVTQGRLVSGAGEISFSARAQGDVTTLKLQINGKNFDVTIDDSVTMDGHGAILTDAEKALLLTLSHKLTEQLDAIAVGTAQIEKLATFGSFLSEAPSGLVHRRVVNGQELPEGVAALTASSVICIAKQKKYTVVYTGRYSSASNGCLTKADAGSANAAARTDAGLDAGGILLQDAGSEDGGANGQKVCRVTKIVVAGYAAGANFCGSGDYSCMGRCGAGCNGIGGAWTVDCLRHDQCSHDMCSSNGGSDTNGCWDEFNAASDDLFKTACNGVKEGPL